MRPALAAALLILIALAPPALAPPARADRALAPPPPTPAADVPPPALALVRRIAAGRSDVDLRLVDHGARQVTPLLEHLADGQWALAAHAATGRWALSRIGTDEPLAQLAGRAVTTPKNVTTLVLGDVENGVVAVAAADKRCVAAKCFESVARFSADGSAVLTALHTSSSTWLDRYVFGATPAPAIHLDKRKSKRGAGLFSFAADDGRVAYQVAGEGLFVEPMPPPPKGGKGAQAPPKQGKPVTRPTLLMEAPLLLAGDALVYFRREPTEQKRGFVEVFDLAARSTTLLYEFPDEYPLWSGGFRLAAATRTVLLVNATSSRPSGALVALPLAGGPARELVTDVLALHDVSADGRFALVSRWRDPARGDRPDNPQRLVVIEVATGRVVSETDLTVDGARVEGAAFVAIR
jgi:hypothetical protein